MLARQRQQRATWRYQQLRSFMMSPTAHCQAYSHLTMWTPKLCGKPLKKACHTSNRRRRKALHRASNWVVHLFAGPGSHKAFKRLESQDTVVVELDICRSRSQDLYHDPLWRLLVKVAKLGRVAAVIGGPPSRTWSVKGHRADGTTSASFVHRTVWLEHSHL